MVAKSNIMVASQAAPPSGGAVAAARSRSTESSGAKMAEIWLWLTGSEAQFLNWKDSGSGAEFMAVVIIVLISDKRGSDLERVSAFSFSACHAALPRRATVGARGMFMGSGIGPDGQPAKVGAPTYVAWAMCGLLLAGCWAWEWYDSVNRPPLEARLPDEVERKLDNGTYLMRDGSIRKELPLTAPSE
ncbi:hypothetical protein T492DRAFT_883745 [Pavlovales sp. CCMP2436]|nr:hypothetical protein T492DRAFT_883745 [Pavlovales sp. CCMP2436]